MLLEDINIILNKQKEFNSSITNNFIEEYNERRKYKESIAAGFRCLENW